MKITDKSIFSITLALVISLTLLLSGCLKYFSKQAIHSDKTAPPKYHNPKASSSPSVNSESIMPESLAVYMDEYISFSYPATWKLESEPIDGYIISSRYWNCNSRIFWFGYRPVSAGEKSVLGEKNQYGSNEQISKLIKVDGETAGLVIQPEGDGSGGYEPNYRVDFLSKSKKIHFFMSIFSGCRKNIDDAYSKDLLPLINTVKIYK